MDNEGMSEMIQKLASMMNNANQDASYYSNDTSSSNELNMDMLQNFLSNMNASSNNENDNQDNPNFNIDLDTMLKIKTMMDSFQSAKNSPEANLLLSLKPYLNNQRKQKLDQYMQFLNISKLLETWNKTNGGANG